MSSRYYICGLDKDSDWIVLIFSIPVIMIAASGTIPAPPMPLMTRPTIRCQKVDEKPLPQMVTNSCMTRTEESQEAAWMEVRRRTTILVPLGKVRTPLTPRTFVRIYR